jgi:alpha-L-fucosidase
MVQKFNDGRDWFFDNRFGLFIHWGIYSLNGWHEQTQWRQRIPRTEYGKRIDDFNPTAFEPNRWLDIAEQTGMRYLCFTTKHHDGFCLWNTAHTDFNVMRSPYGQDVLQKLADACHQRNFPLCLYYSVADWHHPNYPNQNRSHELSGPQPGDQPDVQRYMEFLKKQVHELCTQYGELHGFFWDINRLELDDPSLNAMIRELQPAAIINSRGFDPGDITTVEREFDDFVGKVLAFDEPTEMSCSIGEQSWGYRAEEDYHTLGYLIRDIDCILAKGGNYVLNVGPLASGAFPPEAEQILEAIGKWYHAVQESFDGAACASHLSDNRDILLTRKANTLYVHLCKPPKSTGVLLKPLALLPKKATLLNTGEPVETRVDMLPLWHLQQKEHLRLLNLPANDFSNSVMVIKLEFEDLPVSTT